MNRILDRKAVLPLFFATFAFISAAPESKFSAFAQQQTQQAQQPRSKQAPPPGPRVQTLQQLQRMQQQRQAQGAQRPAAGPPPEVIAAHGKWQVQCRTVPTRPPQQQGAGGKSNKADPLTAGAAGSTPQQQPPAAVRQCGMVQVTQAPGRKVNLSLILGKARQGDKDVIMMRIMVPVGVYLPLGIALEVDGAPVGRVPFVQCAPQACMAVAEASPDTLTKMRKGSVANFIIYEGPGAGISLPISLDGFTKSFDALSKS